MQKEDCSELAIQAFADHHVITPPNRLRNAVRLVDEKNVEDPIARAEKALAGLSDEFSKWMAIERDRLVVAHAAILKNGFTPATRDELFRAAHDIKGDAATFGYPFAAARKKQRRPVTKSYDRPNLLICVNWRICGT